MLVKQLFGVISVFISVFGYIPYLLNLIRGKTKPHIFSWIVWLLLIGISFVSQVVGGAGPGAWMSVASIVMISIVIILSIKKGTKDIQLIDWICMFGALIAIIFWIMTKTPFLSVILITMTDLLAFIPTFRKSIQHPYQETASTYALNSSKLILSIFAIKHYSIITTFYPLYLVFANGLFVVYLLIRRKQLGKNKNKI